MENLALTTLLLPFIGALVVSFSPQRRAAEWGVLFAALTTLCMLSLISAFYQADKVAVTLTLVNVGDVALFGLVIDRVSTLILFVVVFLGLLVTIYSTGYLTDKNREHPHNGTNRYYAFLLVFIGAMAGLVLSSTLLGQLLFFEITGGCSWALISYYQKKCITAFVLNSKRMGKRHLVRLLGFSYWDKSLVGWLKMRLEQ